ncbi:MAG: NYN domain-containing protein [Thermoanaerobaculia bacterium]
MPWLVDGSNVLGAMRVDRHSDAAKGELVKLAASFAKSRHTRLTVVFDGPPPSVPFRSLGSANVVFSGSRPADDIIQERASGGRGWSVVTADTGLANRVRGRHVEIVSPVKFVALLQEHRGEEDGGGEDWAAYFSDPKNRMDF